MDYRLEHWEYDSNQKKYHSFDENDHHLISSCSREEFYDYLKCDVATLFYGKTVVEPRKLHPANAKFHYYRLKNKACDVFVFLSENDIEEMRELDRVRNEINQRSASFPFVNTGKLKTWVKVGIGVAIGAGGYAFANSVVNPEPDFAIPLPAEQVYEEINTRLEKEGKDTYNMSDRFDAASELYQFVDKEEFNHRYELDQVAVTIKTVEQQYDQDLITKKVAKEKLEEIDQDYQQMMSEYAQQQEQAKSK